MSNIVVYHNNLLTNASIECDTTVTGTSANWLKDQRTSTQFQSWTNQPLFNINQTTASGEENFVSWEYAVVINQDFGATGLLGVAGDGAAIFYNNADVADPGVAQNLTGTVRTGDQSMTLLVANNIGADFNLGELMLCSKFTSPQLPAIGIQTDYMPRRTVSQLPNGERQSTRHGGVARKKTYTIGGLSLDEAAEWADLFTKNEGSELVVLEDEQEDRYPCMMNRTMTLNDESKIVSIQLEFEEVAL